MCFVLWGLLLLAAGLTSNGPRPSLVAVASWHELQTHTLWD